MRLRVLHRTTYRYDADVTDSYGLAHVVPRELPWQRVLDHELVVDPRPADVRVDVDHFGNTVTYFQVDVPHRELVVVGRGVVEVDPPGHPAEALEVPWEQARPGERPDVADAWSAVEHALPSPSIAQPTQAFEYAAQSLAPGRPVGAAAEELMRRIYADFAYEPGATTVTSTIDDVLENRSGVCQDFAHLLIACLRSHGLAARYVSGYLATEPPPGRDRVLGADATHAWTAVWLPGGGWLALDPTNDQPAGDRHVTVAWGREYADVAPLRGVIFSEATDSQLSVEVDVDPV